MSVDFRDSLSARLPAPRDDEPSGLRQDILDELTDHLTCSYHRELLRGSDPVNARARTLERFGDPADVARRLWFDAMKGKIMVQRMVMATCLVVTVASLALVGLFWQQAVNAQRIAAAREADAAARQAEMLKQLEFMTQAIQNPRSLDWNPLKFKLTQNTTDGGPVEGVQLIVSRTDAQGLNRTLKSDKDGIVDCGLVNPGEYAFIINQFRTGTGRYVRGDGQVRVQPGNDILKVVVCPMAPAEKSSVKVKVSWPPDLEKEGLVLCALFGFDSRVIADVTWQDGITHGLLGGPTTPAAEFSTSRSPYLWHRSGENKVEADIPSASLHPPAEPSGSFQWEVGSYSISSLLVLRPLPDAGGDAARKRYHVVAGLTTPGARRTAFLVRGEPPQSEKPEMRTRIPGGGNRERNGMRVAQIPIGPNSQSFGGMELDWPTQGGNLKLQPGHVNEWTITLWDELITLVRGELKKSPKRDGKAPDGVDAGD
jgi:hypothetical protein